MKRKLLLLAAFVASALGMRAQTDVTSTYMTDPSFEKNNNTTGDIGSTGVIGSSDWNIITISHARVAFFNADSEVSTYGKTSPSDGTYYLMIRGNASEAKTQTIRQNSDMALPKGKYNISFDYKAARSFDATRNFSVSAVSSDAKTTFGKKLVEIPKESANSSYFAGINWSTETFDFTLENTTNVKINIACETKPSQTVVLFDNIVIRYSNINGDVLAALIAQATAINSKIGTLTSDIATAQGVLDGINNTPAYQSTIDGAITTLRTAINTKVAAYSYNPAGDDVTVLVFRPGFEDMTAESDNYATVKGKDYSSEGWTMVETGDWGYGAIMAYGSDKTFNTAAVPDTDNAGNTGNTLGISVGWGWTQRYQSEVITLKAGSYRFIVNAYNANADAQQFTSKVGFVPTSGDPSLSTKTSFASNTWETDEVDFVLASNTEGRFQIGGTAVSGGSGSNAKIFFDNISLTYFDPLKLAQIQWQETWDALDALDETALPDAAEAAITTALAAAEPTTVEGYNAAKATLQELIDSYDGIKAAYSKLNELIDTANDINTNSAGNTSLSEAIATANTNKETRTIATGENSLASDYTTLEKALHDYITSGAEPADGHPFDITFKINNPGFEANGISSDALIPTGWSIPTRGAKYGTKAKGSISNAKGSYVFNNWVSWWNSLNVQQTVSSLPKGRYEVTAVLAGYNGVATKLEAGGGITWRNMTGENNGIRVSVTGNVTGTSLTIKAETVGKDGGSLLIADDFTLSFIGNKPVLKDLIAKATTLSTSNIGTDVFQIPSSAAEALTTAKAIAQAVLDDDNAYGDAITTAINDLNTAITNFQGATLNAPAADKKYYLTVATTGHASLGKAVVVSLGSTGDNNPTGYTFNASAAPAEYLAQAVAFISANDAEHPNRYYITFEGPAGTLYLTNGTNNSSAASWKASQIQGTTDPSKKMGFDIVATTTANVFNIYNTETNSSIACQTGANVGNLYTESGNADFTLSSEASQASVGLSVKAGKWATRIFPFKPTLPAGVVVYTAAVEGDALNLTEVAEPSANVPYILKNTTGSDVNTTLQGYGTAKQDAYQTGDFIGIYTQQIIPANSYVLQTQGGVQGFYKLGDALAADKSVPYRAYLSNPTNAYVKAFYLDFDDTTGIDSMNGAIEGLLEGEVYDLSGRLVKNPTRGIYIVNGKKVLIK